MFNNIETKRFGLFVGIDMWEVFTTSTVNCSMFSIYVGHHKPTFDYNVLLPCSAFSESNGLYMNILGMVQRTVKSVQSPVKDAEMLHTADVVLCSMVRYILQTVKLPAAKHNTMAVFERSAYLLQIFKQYFPYALNYLDDMSVCIRLLQSSAVKFNSIVYVSVVRSNYSTDIITRNNALFMDDAHEGDNLLRRIWINYND